MNEAIFTALSNPIRRQVIALLMQQDRAAGAISDEFSLGRSTISEHLGVLRQAGLVRERKVGREMIYTLNAEPLADLRDWLAPYETFWKTKLAALAKDIEETPE